MKVETHDLPSSLPLMGISHLYGSNTSGAQGVASLPLMGISHGFDCVHSGDDHWLITPHGD